MSSTFEFSDLDEDCFLDIVKYLSFKERIQFERISREWREKMDRLWASQRTLAFRLDGSYLFCRDKSHRVFTCDHVTFNDRVLPKDLSELRFKVLRKCNNLKVLRWKGRYDELGSYISTKGLSLEHLEVASFSEDMDEIIVEALTTATVPRLRCLDLAKSQHLDRFLALNLRNFFYYSSPKPEDSDVDMLVERGSKLEVLRTNGNFTTEQLENLCKALRGLRVIWGVNCRTSCFLNILPSVEEFLWNGECSNGLFEPFMAKCGRKLKSLVIIKSVSAAAYRRLGRHCPEIEHLDICNWSRLDSRDTFLPLMNLAKLRSIKINSDNYVLEDLDKFLSVSPKLHDIDLVFSAAAHSPSLAIQLVFKYARRHPKRRIKLAVLVVRGSQHHIASIRSSVDFEVPANVRTTYAATSLFGFLKSVC